jgi:hypothetical protein
MQFTPIRQLASSNVVANQANCILSREWMPHCIMQGSGCVRPGRHPNENSTQHATPPSLLHPKSVVKPVAIQLHSTQDTSLEHEEAIAIGSAMQQIPTNASSSVMQQIPTQHHTSSKFKFHTFAQCLIPNPTQAPTASPTG